MIYKITDLKAVEKTGMVYVLVNFWESKKAFTDGKPAVLREDFYMAMRDEDTSIVVDDEGYGTTESGRRIRLSSAKYVEDPADPLVRETVKRDVPAEIRRNIENHWKTDGHKITGDKTWPVKTRPKLIATDPAGILDRPDVKDMKGKDYESVSP